MLNSFNLFLSLLSFWALFMLSSGHISFFYAGCGVFASMFVVTISSRLKLIGKSNEMLYLSLGFYRHFLKLFLVNFIPSIRILFQILLSEKSFTPTSHKIKNDAKGINISALISTINMTSGLLVTNLKGGEISIHAVSGFCFEDFNLKKTQRVLRHINDDNLV